MYDCGTHGRWGTKQVPPAWTALSQALWRREQVDVIAVSHLHWDHYCGFLEPLAGVSPDVQVVMPRLPVLVGAEPLRERFAAALLSLAPLDPALGPLEIDLMRRIKRYAPNAVPVPVSAGHDVTAAGDQWRVLWPPPRIEAGTRGITKLERAVVAYENAAQNSPEVRRRLDAVRDSEAFGALLSEPGLDPELDDSDEPHDFDEPAGLDAEVRVLEEEGDDEPLMEPRSLNEAAAAVRLAANELSLVMVSAESRVLLTGDATRFAMEQAMHRAGRRFNLVVTPHHGGRLHVPDSLLESEVPFWASSAGGRLGKQVSDVYDLKGWHHRTDKHGSALYCVESPDLFEQWDFEMGERW